MFRIVYCRLLVYNGNYNTGDGRICYMKEKVKNIKEWVLSHRKVVTAFIIASSILLMFCGAFVYKKIQVTNHEYIEILYYTSQVISAIFVISGVVIAVWQYYLASIDSKRNKDLICVQKAVDLSEYYKDNILCYYAAINYIFDHSGINEILLKIDKTKIKHFDDKELHVFLSDNDIEKLKALQKSEQFFSVVIKADLIYNLGLRRDAIIKDDDAQNSFSATSCEILSRFVNKLITTVLNNTEYFALHFTHNVADETVVYKSLHQTYVGIVRMLYYHIAIKNPLSRSKYFTNIIELYNIWNNQTLEEDEIFVQDLRTMTNKGTVIKSE